MVDKDDIIKMANDAGIKGPAPARAGFKMYASPQRLLSFATLVAAAEREACARVCEEDLRDEYIRQDRPAQDEAFLFAAIADCAEAIRARGGK